MRGHSKSIRHPIKKREQRYDVNRLRNLIFAPTSVAQFLNVVGGGAVCSVRDQFYIAEKSTLGDRKAGFAELAFENRAYTFISGSLNTQEVSMTVQSIRAAVQVRDVAGNHLLIAAREMTFREMHSVGKLDHLTQEVRACAEALDNSWHLFPARACSRTVTPYWSSVTENAAWLSPYRDG